MIGFSDVVATEQLTYRIAGRTLTIEVLDELSGDAIRDLFADWYLLPQDRFAKSAAPLIRIRSNDAPATIPPDFDRFEIAGEGVCHTKASTSYIDIQESRIAIGLPGCADVEIWINGLSSNRSPETTRLISYGLSSALRRCGLFELHSAAVVEPESGTGVLVIGPSGSGKSTLTVQLSAAGWSYLSDDVLMLSGASADVEAWSLRRCFAVTDETLMASGLHNSNRGLFSRDRHDNRKQRFAPSDVFGSAFKESCTPRKVFFSEVARSEKTQVARLSSGEAMTRLIRMSPWSCYDTQTASAHLETLGQLVKQTESFALFAGKDLLDHTHASRLIGGYVRS